MTTGKQWKTRDDPPAFEAALKRRPPSTRTSRGFARWSGSCWCVRRRLRCCRCLPRVRSTGRVVVVGWRAPRAEHRSIRRWCGRRSMSLAVVVWRVLREGETASPADSAGVGVGESADGCRAGVKRAGMVQRFHALIGAMRQGWGRVASLRHFRATDPGHRVPPPTRVRSCTPGGMSGRETGERCPGATTPGEKLPRPWVNDSDRKLDAC